jgi:enoyl-CoA hydratase/carnithine racemase
MEWKPDRASIPEGFVIQPEELTTLDVSMPAEGVARIVLNRPDKLNAFNSAMLKELRSVLWLMNFDPGVRVIILTGAGRGFSSGRDIPELRTERGMPLPQYRAWMRANQEAFDDIEAIEKPLIAAINGVCAGGGVELAASCDFRIASTEATFLLPEIFIGVMPASGACSRLIQLIGIENVKDLVMTGRTIDAEEARGMRLVGRTAAADQLDDAALALAQQLTRGAPQAVGMAKHVINMCQNVDTDTGRMLERLAQSSLVGTADSTEGIRAFLDKRRPEFGGR